MALSLKLPVGIKKEGWKVKIRENERSEPPHITIFRGIDEWRVNLRNGQFLEPPGGSWNEIPKIVRKCIQDNLKNLQTEWDKKYPHNPISSTRDNNEA